MTNVSPPLNGQTEWRLEDGPFPKPHYCQERNCRTVATFRLQSWRYAEHEYIQIQTCPMQEQCEPYGGCGSAKEEGAIPEDYWCQSRYEARPVNAWQPAGTRRYYCESHRWAAEHLLEHGSDPEASKERTFVRQTTPIAL